MGEQVERVEIDYEDPHLNDEVLASLERHPVIAAHREAGATDEMLRAAAHKIVDRALDQADNRRRRSDFLKRRAGEFGTSGYLRFVPED